MDVSDIREVNAIHRTTTCIRCKRTIILANEGITTCVCGVRHHWAPNTVEAHRG